MKKAVVIRAITIALILFCILGFIGYQKANELQKADNAAAIMVDDVVQTFRDMVNPNEILSEDKVTTDILPGGVFPARGWAGSESSVVKVYLDGHLYREYVVNFVDETYENTVSNEYVDPDPVVTLPTIVDVIIPETTAPQNGFLE